MTQDTTLSDNRLTIRILSVLLVLAIIIAALVVTFGLQVLTFVGIAAAVLVFVIMVAFTTGR